MDSLCPVHQPGRRYLISQVPTMVPHMWDMCPISTNHLLGCWQHWRHTLILMKTQSGLSHLKWPKCWSRRVEDMTKTSSSFILVACRYCSIQAGRATLGCPETPWRYFLLLSLRSSALTQREEKNKQITPWHPETMPWLMWTSETERENKTWCRVCLKVDRLRLPLTGSFSLASQSDSTVRWLGDPLEFTRKWPWCLHPWQLEEIYFQPQKSNREWSSANASSLAKRTQWGRCCL